MLIMGMYFRKYVLISNKEIFSKKKSFGRFSYKLLEAWRPYMTWKSCIEIWRVLIFSYFEIILLNWATWMWAKSPRKAYYTHKQALLIMQVPKSGRTNPMTANLISGHWAVFFMKCVHWSRRLELTIWMVYLKEFWKDNILRFQPAIAWTYGTSSRASCKWMQSRGLPASKYSICPL